ncbi:MAG TPA: XRE family transcriptional regulator [Nocardioidaceae bacterium]|nr:XRE family transcriptional regulator [Nocardioidaceae bacterium]
MTELGEALRAARRAQGMTQDDLVERAGITQAALSRYENDLREPSREVIEALAEALGVTPSLLLAGHRVLGAMAVDVHMRRRATAPARAWKRLEARLNMYRLHTSQLMDEVALRTERVIPLIDPAEEDAATAARITRMQWRMPVGPVRSLTRWMESAGCLVIEEDFATTRVDGLSQWVEDCPVILINARMPADRKRLTLAHELGHLVLHSEHMTTSPEEDANAFAAEFLMPAEVIRPELRNLTLGKLHDLKRSWMVSMQALIERAWNLKLLSASERARLYKQFGARGWRTREPLSNELPPELPRLAQEIGEALAARGLSPVEIAQIAGFSGTSEHNPFQPKQPRLRAL